MTTTKKKQKTLLRNNNFGLFCPKKETKKKKHFGLFQKRNENYFLISKNERKMRK